MSQNDKDTPDVADIPIEDHLRDRLQKITDQILDHVESVMRSGTPKAKSELIRQVFPVLARALNPAHESSELDHLKAMQIQMMEQLNETAPSEPLPATEQPAYPRP